jgi:PPOX class probable F420-dependent enzyme
MAGATPDLDVVRNLVASDHGLAEVFTTRADGSGQASVVNAGVLAHPTTGEDVVGFVARGGSHKLANLRALPRVTMVLRAGWNWVAVEGRAELVGPDDPHRDLDADGVRLLLRDIFLAAGGRHDDFDTYDRVMAQERRTAVLVHPERVYSNSP